MDGAAKRMCLNVLIVKEARKHFFPLIAAYLLFHGNPWEWQRSMEGGECWVSKPKLTDSLPRLDAVHIYMYEQRSWKLKENESLTKSSQLSNLFFDLP